MKRLRDSEAHTPLLKKAQALLDAAPPTPESHERMLRVRRELDRPRGLLAGLQRLPALAMAMLVVLFGASAFAAVRIYEAVRPPAAIPPAAERSAVHAAARKAKRAVVATAAPQPEPARELPATAPAAAPAPIPQAAPEPQAIGSHRPAATAGHAKTHGRVPARRSATQPAVLPHDDGVRESALPPSAGDSELVHRAVKALRRDRDPALAARLLKEHRARAPRGPLAEEALALEIEAALAQGDARAPVLAREYLARHPHGRYASIAERALRGAAP